MKKYTLIAGVNGAGKSTLYQTMEEIKGMPLVNVDEIVRSFGKWNNIKDVIKAGYIAVDRINEYFSKGITFAQETTLCGHSIMKNINRAIESGYDIEMHYVGVNSVDIAKERISYRVKKGGHDIPDIDVERRYVESLRRMREVIPLCNLLVLYDNSEKFIRFAEYKNGDIYNISENPPQWYLDLMSGTYLV